MHLREELEQRWFLNQYTHDSVFDVYDAWGQNFYCGYDPTADSLTIGNFITIMAAVNFMKKWNTFYMVIGGATWMIGDPGWKDAERSFLNEETLAHNQACLTKQVQSILANLEDVSGETLSFKVVNNYDFFKDMGVLDFLRHVWKHITINTMIQKDTVKKRIEDPDKSISFTEFTYTLLQGYDFYKLYTDFDVKLQIAWSDQRWNITTWTELIRKKTEGEAFGITTTLILDSTGKKFGKSEGNAIWLDPAKSTPYSVFQYFINTNDEDVARYLKLFTLLPLDEIMSIVEQHEADLWSRSGQQALAQYVVTTIFWKDAAVLSQKISRILFGGEDTMDVIAWLNDTEKKALLTETWSPALGDERSLLELCVVSWLCTSKWEARKLLSQNAISLNTVKVQDDAYVLSDKDFCNGLVLLQKWKKTFKVISK